MNEINPTFLVTNSVSTSRRLALKFKAVGLIPVNPREMFLHLYYHPLFITETQRLVDSGGFEIEIMMLSIQSKLKAENYFKKALELRGIRKVVSEGLQELAMSELHPEQLEQQTLVNADKEASLKELYSLYLKKTHHFDYPKLLVALLKDLENGKYDQILANHSIRYTDDLELSGIEKKLFELILHKLKSEKINANKVSFEETVKKKASQMSMCSKITEEALIADMFSWMKKNNLDCAQNSVLVLDYDQYAPIFYNLSLKHELPIYLTRGLKFREFSFYETLISSIVHARQHQYAMESVAKRIFPKKKNKLEDIFLGKASRVIKDLLNNKAALKFESLSKAYDILLERLASLSLSPKELGQDENGMFIGTYSDLQHLPLENLAILGLDSAHYPIKKHLNPLLTDEERKVLNEKFSCNLKTTDELAGEYILEEIIGNVSGQVYLGLTSHNKDTGKIKVPSSLYNKIFTYSGKTASLKEVYEACGISGDLLKDLDLDNPFFELHSSFAVIQNKKDTENRIISSEVNSEDFGEFKVEAARVSATGLERFFKCPFKYYLMDLSGLEPPEQEEEDVTFWLDPMTYGTYVHGVYERLLKPFLESGRDYSEYLSTLNEASIDKAMVETEEEEYIKTHRPEVPEHIKDLERKRIKDLAFKFIEKEKEYAIEGYYPVGLEEDFRKKDINLLGVKLSGKIDRIDTNGKGAYRIIDYKSGRNRHKDPQSDMFLDSKDYVHVQHGLYSVAARAILGAEITSVEAGYYYATDNGQWKRVMRDEKIFLDKFEKIIQLYKYQIDGGKFFKNPEHCSQCDVKNLCYGRPRARAEILKEIPEIKTILGLVYGR